MRRPDHPVVAVDGRRLQDSPLTGVGRGLANLLPLIADRVDLRVLTDGSRPPASVDLPTVPLRRPARTPEPVWLQTVVPAWLRRHPALFHGTYNAVPLLTVSPTVVTIHDLSWEDHPVDFPSRARQESFRWQARAAAKRARSILTVSEFVRQAIIRTYGRSEESVVVVPNAVDPVFRPAAGDQSAAAGLGVHGRYVVALEGARRRNADLAVRSWRRACQDLGETVPLIVVGGPMAEEEKGGVVRAGRLDDPTWAALLAGAAAFLYPTRYEGFGMPALEAAASGTPVIATPAASLPEVLGDAAEWCDSLDEGPLAAGLRRVLDDAARSAQLREKGLARAAGWPTWADSAGRLLDVYREAAG